MGNSESQLSENNVVDINTTNNITNNREHYVKQETIPTSNDILNQINRQNRQMNIANKPVNLANKPANMTNMPVNLANIPTNRVNRQTTQTNMHPNPNNPNTIYTKMTPQEYKEFQEYRHLLNNNQSSSNNIAKQTNDIDSNINRRHLPNVENSQMDPPMYNHHIKNVDVKDKFTAVQNDRIYQQPNAPYHPQPRMNISIQEKGSSCNMKDDYQNVYQQRQQDVTKQYLNSLHQNGKTTNRNEEIERIELMQKQQSLLFNNNNNNNLPSSYNNTQKYSQNLNSDATEYQYIDKQNKQNKQNKRHNKYLNELGQFAKDQDPYTMLNVTRETELRDITRAYRKMAKAAHPDKGGDTESFNNLTKAYLFILEKHKSRNENANHNYQDLKQNFQNYRETHSNEASENNYSKDEAPLGMGEAFNQNVFNKIYEENKLCENHDEGYSDWINNNKVHDTEIEPVFSQKFNLNVFNTVFNELKDKEMAAEITEDLTIYQEPSPAFQGTAIGFTEIGDDKISDFGKANPLDSGKHLDYTDYRKAMTQTHLIHENTINHNRKQYKDIEDLERERDSIQYDMSLEERALYDKHLEFKRF